MAENAEGQDKSEEATPERREEFRQKGQVAVSHELSGVFLLGLMVTILGYYLPVLVVDLEELFKYYFYRLSDYRVNGDNIGIVFGNAYISWLKAVAPLFVIATMVALVSTLIQTRANFSWKRLAPDFNRLNILKGLANMVTSQALMNLFKGVGKMSIVSLVAYLILRSEWQRLPALLGFGIERSWAYWAEISQMLFWSVAGLLLIIAAFDYLYNFWQIEKQLKMTKQEVKEDTKKQEGDPHLKARIKRKQREIAYSKVAKKTREATVIVTNPTHYAVALKYEPGMRAPLVLAKGLDHLALHMRKIAKEADIPIVENKPLARFLHASVAVGAEIPESVYKAVSEIIRYVYKIKNKSLV